MYALFPIRSTCYVLCRLNSNSRMYFALKLHEVKSLSLSLSLPWGSGPCPYPCPWGSDPCPCPRGFDQSLLTSLEMNRLDRREWREKRRYWFKERLQRECAGVCGLDTYTWTTIIMWISLTPKLVLKGVYIRRLIYKGYETNIALYTRLSLNLFIELVTPRLRPVCYS